jgi:hypothetical protein
MNAVRAYRASLRLYPKPFRDEYGAEMVALLEEQLLHEPAWRVRCRAVADLAITVPNQHLESHMSSPPNRSVPLIYTVVTVAAVALAVVGGTSAAALSVGVLVAISSGAMAVIAWRRVLPLRRPDATRHWWAFVLSGPILVGTVIVAAGFGVNAWFLGLLCVFTGFGLTAVGFGLGLVRLLTRPAAVAPA